MLENVKPVGYHVWIDATHLALFVLGGQGQPSTLQIRRHRRPARAETIDSRIGRSLLRRPRTGTISYVSKPAGGRWVVKELDPKTRQTSAIVETADPASEDCAWDAAGRLIMAGEAGSKLFIWGPAAGAWRELGDLSAHVGRITRLAVWPSDPATPARRRPGSPSSPSRSPSDHRVAAPGRRPDAGHPRRRPLDRGDARHDLARSGHRRVRSAARSDRRRARVRSNAGRSSVRPGRRVCRTLVDALDEKLARENGIVVRPASRVVVTAGGNLAFMNAVLAITDPGDEVILPVPFYFNHEMAIVMAGARAVPVPTTADYQLDLDAIAPRDHAADARDRDRVAEQPDRRRVSGGGAARGERALPGRAASFTFTTRRTSTSPTAAPRHFSPGSIAGAAGAHHLALLDVEGVRDGELADRLHGDSRGALDGREQDSGHDADLRAGGVAGGGDRGAPRRCRLRAGARSSGLDRTRRRILEALRDASVPCDSPEPEGAFYYFVQVHTSLDSMTFVERLIREHRVAAIPGSAFGAAGGCYLRVSYGALDEATVNEGAGAARARAARSWHDRL